MAFLREVVTPAGVTAVHEVGLAGLARLADDGSPHMGQWEDLVSELPELIKAGGDVASQVYRAVNYSPAVYPTTYTGAYTTSVPGMFQGISPTMLLVLGGGLLALLMLRK